MATTTRKTGNNGPVLRSQSPSGRFYSPRSSGSSPFASSSTAFSPHQSTFLHRSASPTRVNLYTSSKSPSSSVKFSTDRPDSRSISASNRNQVVKNSGNNPIPSQKRMCMCSPTNHPGSFRCSMHKNVSNQAPSASYPANRLNARRSAMTNSLVRIGTVEGDLVKRALAALIRPSSHSQKRRGSFEPRPSRLSVMSKAEDDVSSCQ